MNLPKFKILFIFSRVPCLSEIFTVVTSGVSVSVEGMCVSVHESSMVNFIKMGL